MLYLCVRFGRFYIFFLKTKYLVYCIRMEGLTICNGFVVKLLLFCIMVCLTSVCVCEDNIII